MRHVLHESPEQMLCCSFMTAFAKWLVIWALRSQARLGCKAKQEIGPSQTRGENPVGKTEEGEAGRV